MEVHYYHEATRRIMVMNLPGGELLNC